MAGELNNVNFELLLRAHNGDRGRAEQAWQHICNMGRFGSIPSSYGGGLDTCGLMEQNPLGLDKDIFRRIEDLSAGDDPSKLNR